jgi:uncharacterized protein YggE
MRVFFRTTIWLLGLVLVWFSPVGADEMAGPASIQRLTVRGAATLKVPADQLRLRVGVVTEAGTVKDALSRNNDQVAAVIDALQKLGLTKKEYRTGQFQIQPRWSPRPREMPENWRPHIIGYTVHNSLNIETRQISLAGPIVGAVGQAGANEIDALSFDLADPRKVQSEAIRKATANALEDAATLAASASVRLVRILSLNLENASAAPMPVRSDAFALKTLMTGSAPVPPIESGDVTVRAAVVLIYQIENKKKQGM